LRAQAVALLLSPLCSVDEVLVSLTSGAFGAGALAFAITLLKSALGLAFAPVGVCECGVAEFVGETVFIAMVVTPYRIRIQCSVEACLV